MEIKEVTVQAIFPNRKEVSFRISYFLKNGITINGRSERAERNDPDLKRVALICFEEARGNAEEIGVPFVALAGRRIGGLSHSDFDSFMMSVDHEFAAIDQDYEEGL